MTAARRRACAALAALMLATGSAVSAAEPPPPPARELPQNWLQAPVLKLWPGAAPGAEGYRAASPPQGWSAAYVRNVQAPTLHVFRPARPNGHAVLVIPGGAYWFVSVANEGAELAPLLTERGYTVFVLTYRLPGEGWAQRAQVPLQDAQRAMRVVRSQAAQFGFDAGAVSVIGFSAGGHLAATLATRHAQSTYIAVDATDRLDARPHGVALIYPVVSLRRPWTHELSRELLLGATAPEALVEQYSAELQVNAATPPLFIVHALDDEAVPVDNSLQLARALRTAQRPFEMHLLQQGGHAFGIGRPRTPSAQWISLFDAWLQSQPRPLPDQVREDTR